MYGGTKNEMSRLLKDAQKLSGVKYDINNLADVYSAIHVIQEELGVAGVAAQEAESTLSGSLGAMKASFSNFIGNLTLGRDIGPALNDLVQTSTNFLFNNLIPALGNIVKALPGALSSAVKILYPAVKNQVAELIKNIATYIQTTLPDGLSKGTEVFLQLAKGLTEKIITLYPLVKTYISELISNISLYIQEWFPEICNTGADILMELINGLVNDIPSLILALGDIVTNIIDFLGANLPLMATKGFEIITSLASGIFNNIPSILASMITVLANVVQAIINNLPTIFAKGIEITANVASGIISAIPDLFNKVWEGFCSVDWASIGSNIISGIVNGIKSGVSAVINAATEVARNAFNAAKNFLGIKSPSRKFKYLGEMSDEGVAQGLIGKVSVVKDAIKKVTGTMENSFNPNLDSFRVGGSINRVSSNKGGFQQTVIIQSPKALNPSEVARQTRNSTKRLALKMSLVGD